MRARPWARPGGARLANGWRGLDRSTARPVAGGHVRLGALVEDVGVPQRAEAVSESRRNPELSRALARQLDAHPPGEVRRAPAEVHGHVQYPTAQDLDQLPLRSAGRLGRRDQDDIPADTPFEAGYSLPEARRPARAHIVGPAVRTTDPHGSPLSPEFGPSKWGFRACAGEARCGSADPVTAESASRGSARTRCPAGRSR